MVGFGFWLSLALAFGFSLWPRFGFRARRALAPLGGRAAGDLKAKRRAPVKNGGNGVEVVSTQNPSRISPNETTPSN
jgi:hypothetical protein